MISRIFKKKALVRALGAPTVPEGTVVWAVGDIHGRLDLLEPLVERVLADAAGLSATRKLVIFLGDYVDRGPESKGVIRYLASLPQDVGIEWLPLKGNHEQAMLGFLADPATGPKWCEYGGENALRSYGLRIPDLAHRPDAWARVAADLQHKLTAPEIAFLQTLGLCVTVGDYFFAHAGARPGVALDRQSPNDLMWIRRPFLDSMAAFERVIVHGHTPTERVHSDHRRIGIDTKAYDTGILTALRLEGSDRSLLQSVGPRRGPQARRGGDEYLLEENPVVVVRATKLDRDPADSALTA